MVTALPNGRRCFLTTEGLMDSWIDGCERWVHLNTHVNPDGVNQLLITPRVPHKIPSAHQ